MSFTSFPFLFSFLVLLILYYVCPSRYRRYILLFANIGFYSLFGIRYVSILIIIALVTWLMGLLLTKDIYHNRKKSLLLVGLTAIILPLVLFKYSYFVLVLINRCTQVDGIWLESAAGIIAPIGLSYYTLQAISYLTDIYRGQIESELNFFSLFLYLSFFPTVTSGPILRYADFVNDALKRIDEVKASYQTITNGLIYFIYGAFVKLVIADRIAVLANAVFDNFIEQNYGTVELIAGAIAYSIQIYADFGGYSAMAVGIAKMMGLEIMENFRAPYMAKSIKEFWSRWHISLSSWLRDYVYIPLGGNRKGKLRKYINLLITFAISGIWHGARGHFIIWGIIHGVYQIMSDMTGEIRDRIEGKLELNKNAIFYKAGMVSITFLMVTVAWIFFRTGIKEGIRYIYYIFTKVNFTAIWDGTLYNIGFAQVEYAVILLPLLFMLLVDYYIYKKIRIDQLLNSQGYFVKGFVIYYMVISILILGKYGVGYDEAAFIYTGF